MEKIPTSLTGFFAHIIKPYKWFIFGLLITSIIWSVQYTLTPYLLKIIVDLIASNEENYKNIYSLIKIPIFAYFLVWFIGILNFRLIDYLRLKLFPTLKHDITNSMFSYLNRHSHSYLQNNFVGSLAYKIMDMSHCTISAFTRINEGVANIFAFLIAVIAVSFVSPIFGAILVSWAIIFISITIYFSKRTKSLSRIYAESKSTLSGKIVDKVSNLANIRLFARNSFEDKNIAVNAKDCLKKDQAVQWYILKMRIFWDASFFILLSSCLSSLVYLFSKGQITVGDFVFVITVSLNIFMHIWNLAGQFVLFVEELGKCSQALIILSKPHDITDIEGAKDIKIKKGKIEFKNVTFQFQRKQKLFQNLNIDIKASSKVGLVGNSGYGKSTFVNLILRIFDINSGNIKIDNQEINKVTQNSLHKQISMIPQDTCLFHRNLMENIRYGKLDASDEEVIEASKLAHCHEFIQKLPEKYDSMVGERGVKLSGGQRQRIAIARAMLKRAPILILDEATSSLDSITEKYIQDSLDILTKKCTTIIIAHRLSTLAKVDRILFFENGEIVEDGTHRQLLARKGKYYKMWHMQADGFINGHEE